VEIFLLILGGLLLLWFVVAQVGRSRERRRRRPVKEALGASPATALDLPAVDLMERDHDRVCLVYWTDRAMAWQYSRRLDVIRVIRFDEITGLAIDPSILVMAVGTADGKHYAWQFDRSSARLVPRLTSAIGKARPASGKGDSLLREIRGEIGPLAWG
jgi:hypothetical protein